MARFIILITAATVTQDGFRIHKQQ